MNGKPLHWLIQMLIPAMMSAGLMILLFIAGQLTTLDDKLDAALLKLERHDTVLRQKGLMK